MFKCLSHIFNLTYAIAGVFSAFPNATSNNNNLCTMKHASISNKTLRL